jgi:hypothetical protein
VLFDRDCAVRSLVNQTAAAPTGSGTGAALLQLLHDGHQAQLMDEAAPPKSSLAAAQQQLRLAKRDLEQWQSAYDGYSGDDPQKFHREIREAEQRITAARKVLRELRKS